MPAVTIDAAVTSSARGLFPNPIAPIDLPNALPSKDGGAILAPVNMSAVQPGSIGAPVSITALSSASIDTPVTIDALDIEYIAAPSTITTLSVAAVAAPSTIDAADVSLVPAPASITTLAVAAIATPAVIDTEDAAVIPAPSLITAIPVPSINPPFALNHARILYNNKLMVASVTPSSGSNASDVLIPNTADRWTFTATGDDEILFTLPSNVGIDTVCIGAHNLADIGADIEVFYDVDASAGGFISLAPEKTVLTNNAIMIHVGTIVSARRIQINITGGSGEAYIGSIYAGVALQMQRPFFAGHSPINLSAVTDYYSSRTESGNFIGREIRSREFSTSAEWNNLDSTWYRTYMQPFVISAKTLPFYFGWNLLQYPDDVGYCMTNADIQPAYNGTRALMQVGFDLIGLA